MDNEVSGYNGAKPQEGRSIMGEVTGDTTQPGGGKKPAGEGVYRHPVAKNPDGTPIELITQHDPLLGDGQSRAAIRAGFEFVGPAPEGAIKQLGAPSLQAEVQKASENAELVALKERMAALEALLAAQPAQGGDAPDAGSQGAENAEEQSFKELQALAKDLGVSAKGSKEELTQRVADARVAAEKGNQ